MEMVPTVAARPTSRQSTTAILSGCIFPTSVVFRPIVIPHSPAAVHASATSQSTAAVETRSLPRRSGAAGGCIPPAAECLSSRVTGTTHRYPRPGALMMKRLPPWPSLCALRSALTCTRSEPPSTVVASQARATISAWLIVLPGAPTRAIRMSSTRLPGFVGLPLSRAFLLGGAEAIRRRRSRLAQFVLL